MNIIEALLVAWAAGLVLERRGDKIIVKGLTPETPPQLLEALRSNRADLLVILPSSPIVQSAREPTT
jgi:hypothetical protein